MSCFAIATIFGFGGGKVILPSWRTVAPRITSSSILVNGIPSFLGVKSSTIWRIFVEYKLEDCVAILLGKSVNPITFTLFFVSIILLGTVTSQFPPCSAAKSTITEPGFISSTISFGHNFGAGIPGMRAVVITISISGACFLNNSISFSMNSLEAGLA